MNQLWIRKLLQNLHNCVTQLYRFMSELSNFFMEMELKIRIKNVNCLHQLGTVTALWSDFDILSTI